MVSGSAGFGAWLSVLLGLKLFSALIVL